MPKQLAYNTFLQQALKYGFSLFGLPKTGQTTKYRDNDDGDLKKGYPEKLPRFVDNGDGTITDKATGLMWVKEPGAIGGNFGSAGNPSSMNWLDAIDRCLALDYAGHHDWRVPNVMELLSILNYGACDPTSYTTYFPYTQGSLYWSSTVYHCDPTKWFVVSFQTGGVSYIPPTFPWYVRPVRLGVPA